MTCAAAVRQRSTGYAMEDFRGPLIRNPVHMLHEGDSSLSGIELKPGLGEALVHLGFLEFVGELAEVAGDDAG